MGLSISPLFSGSGGNATYVGTEKTGLLIDAGLPGGKVEQALDSIDICPASLAAILVTHEHADHIRGIGVLSRRYGIPVYANAATWAAMQGKIGPLPSRNMREIDRGEFFVGDICARPVPLSHDAADPTGYILTSGTRTVGVMTDTGRFTPSMYDACQGVDILILESNHDRDMLLNGRYPQYLKKRILSGRGHLSNADAAKVAVELAARGVRGILLGHLSRENNLPALAYGAVSGALKEARILPGRDISLGTTRRSSVTGFYTLK